MSQESATSNTNRLIHESSPYLLQHAHNPVEWFAWGKEALEKAGKENKPILVSIGYSSCHWCHVMERESFENEEIAAVMNENFINIKVDREERPEIDAIYMDAAHAMGLQGGWPLNVFLTSDAKPFYGGTYFPPAQWTHILKEVSKAYKEKQAELVHTADQLTEHLNNSEIKKFGLSDTSATYSVEDLEQSFQKLEKTFDKKDGGLGQAPKFPMPNVYLFLLRVYASTGSEEALQQVNLTLTEMARGGIYDQLGGGFARYSTDGEWFAPHFEKMLYDNGQLLSLYAEAYNVTGNPLYKQVAEETTEWLQREMRDPSGGYYSALDADSEGEEGKFYVWDEDEIEKLLGDDAGLFMDYYNTSKRGNWEPGKNILHKKLSDKAFANKHNISEDEVKEKAARWKEILLPARNNRVKPGLDDKVLTSWNGLLLKGFSDAYRVFGDEKYLKLAEENAGFLLREMYRDGRLFHTWKDNKASIEGYLDDYAFLIDGLLSLYQATFNEDYLYTAKELTEQAIDHFYDEEENMFFYTISGAENLIARKKEIFDNVIPSSNSAMAGNLYWLSIFFDNSCFRPISEKMLSRVKKIVIAEPRFTSNWGILLSNFASPTAEVAITGEKYLEFRKEIDSYYLPNKVLVGTKSKSQLPLLENRSALDDKTTIFVCFNRTCRLPVHSVKAAVDQIK